MISVFFVFLLLSTPVTSQPESPKERQLWWSNFWNGVTEWFNNIVDTGKKAWDALELDVVFPKITDALDKVIEHCKTTLKDIGDGVQFLITYSTSFWKDTTEGLAGKTALEQIEQIIKNVDDIANCDYYTFEMLMDVKCNIDRPAFISALAAIHSSFDPVVTLVDQSGCSNAIQPLEVEFDINITTDEGRNAVPEFKQALEKFKPAQEAALEPFLSDQQPDAALSVEPSFCEAYDEGRKEFEDASENVRNLTEELNELIEAAKEEGKAAGGAVWNFFQRFINVFKKDPVDEKKEQKEAELREAKQAQEHGANAILGASQMCADGTMRGPRRRDNGEPVCRMEGRRLAVFV